MFVFVQIGFVISKTRLVCMHEVHHSIYIYIYIDMDVVYKVLNRFVLYKERKRYF